MVPARAVSNQMVLYRHVWNDNVTHDTTKQPHLAATVQVQSLSLFGYNAQMPDEKEATSPWRTGGDHWHALVLRG